MHGLTVVTLMLMLEGFNAGTNSLLACEAKLVAVAVLPEAATAAVANEEAAACWV